MNKIQTLAGIIAGCSIALSATAADYTVTIAGPGNTDHPIWDVLYGSDTTVTTDMVGTMATANDTCFLPYKWIQDNDVENNGKVAVLLHGGGYVSATDWQLYTASASTAHPVVEQYTSRGYTVVVPTYKLQYNHTTDTHTAGECYAESINETVESLTSFIELIAAYTGPVQLYGASAGAGLALQIRTDKAEIVDTSVLNGTPADFNWIVNHFEKANPLFYYQTPAYQQYQAQCDFGSEGSQLEKMWTGNPDALVNHRDSDDNGACTDAVLWGYVA
ncbi:hypothetical protein OAV62_02085, partial [bacterium]|nr:hypothetical protein [bacterium]